MRQAVELWRGDPSELASEGWALTEVEERRMQVVRLAIRAGELELARGEPDGAQQMGEAALRVDPWCDRGHHIAASAYAVLGDSRAMKRALERYRSALEELGSDAATSNRRVQALADSLALP